MKVLGILTEKGVNGERMNKRESFFKKKKSVNYIKFITPACGDFVSKHPNGSTLKWQDSLKLKGAPGDNKCQMPRLPKWMKKAKHKL